MSKGLTNGIALGAIGDIDLTKVYATSKKAVDIYVPTTRQEYSKYTTGSVTAISHSLGVEPTRVGIVRTKGYPSPYHRGEIVMVLFNAYYRGSSATLDMNGYTYVSTNLSSTESSLGGYAPIECSENYILSCYPRDSTSVTIRGSSVLSNLCFLEAGVEYTVITMAE